MATLERIVVVWSGNTGLPGVSVFYGDFATSANADVKTFFNSIKGAFNTSLSWSIPTGGDTINDATGTINGVWSNVAGGGTVTGSAAGNYAAGVGAYCNWRTATILNGRRLMGRTFLTNLVTGCYDSTGTIDNSNLGTLQTAATTLANTGKLKVWHRPSPGGSNGASGFIATASLPDQVTSVRSRRR